MMWLVCRGASFKPTRLIYFVLFTGQDASDPPAAAVISLGDDDMTGIYYVELEPKKIDFLFPSFDRARFR